MRAYATEATIYGDGSMEGWLRGLERLASNPYFIRSDGSIRRAYNQQGLEDQTGNIITGIITGAGAGAALRGILGRVGGALGGLLGRGGGTAVSILESNAGHIFRNATGHLADTPANRQLLINTASRAGNLLGADKYGNQWHAQILRNGHQVWTSSRGGVIRNGGLNTAPRTFNSQTGLSRP